MRNRRETTRPVPTEDGRWTREQGRQLLDEWAASGAPMATFARERGIHPQRLAWWRKRFKGEAATASPRFVPVTVRAGVAPGREPVAATVDFAGGVRVELRTLDAASAVWVASVAHALGGAS